MYTSTDYINYDNFNEIENKIFMLNSKIKEKNNTIPSYEKTIWNANDIVYIELVENIENGIENLKKHYIAPPNWISSRNWKEKSNFSYVDINRWINNLNLIEKSLQEYDPIYCGTFYCGEEVIL